MNKIVGLLAISIFFTACIDNAIVDTYQEISGRNWTYVNKVRIPIVITDTKKTYNLYFNLRHTANYKYSNIFVLIRQISPDKKKTAERKEFQLAYPDGEWLGDGVGNLYTYQMLFKERYKFPKKGIYTFIIEQNMRDNPLREINDVGLRIEPAS